MNDYTDVDAYIAGSDQWPDEITAIRPILLSCGLMETTPTRPGRTPVASWAYCRDRPADE